MTGITNGSNHNQVGTSSSEIAPNLGSLANNGGPTQTMLPQSGSPLIGAGSSFAQLSAAVSSTTANTVTVNNPYGFASSNLPLLTSGQYYILQVDGEQMGVTGVTLQGGYQVGNVLTLTGIAGATTAATLTVTAVTNGFITGTSLTNAGSYTGSGTIIYSDVAVTGGGGTGAAFTVTVKNGSVSTLSYISPASRRTTFSTSRAGSTAPPPLSITIMPPSIWFPISAATR